MKAFVFKPNNALIGKFDVSNTDQIPDELLTFGESHAISAYDYIECSGKTWTLMEGSEGLALKEGREYGSSVATSAGDSAAPGQQGDVTFHYRDAYTTAGAISGIGGVIKGLGIIFGLILVLVGFVAASELGAAVVFGSLIISILSGTIIYVIGVLVSAQGQILKATLDTAVHTSPFLSEDQKLTVMRLRR